MPTRGPPRVSVAIPVYNGAPYLAATIESVLRQNLEDFELVICDDSSTDGSADIAAAYRDPRIRLLHNPSNLGFGGNWNRCLSEARGRYIKIMPQDDLLDPECLQRQVAVLDADDAGRVALVACARDIISPSGRTLMRRGGGNSRSVVTGAELARRSARMGTNPVGEPGAVLFRAAAARSAGPFDGARPFVIDIDYWLRLLRFGDAVLLPEALASFRVSPSSNSVLMARRQAAEFSAFLADLAAKGPYRLSRSDLWLASLSVPANALARTMIYRLLLKGQAGSKAATPEGN